MSHAIEEVMAKMAESGTPFKGALRLVRFIQNALRATSFKWTRQPADSLESKTDAQGRESDKNEIGGVKALHFYDKAVSVGNRKTVMRSVIVEQPDGQRYYSHSEVRGRNPDAALKSGGASDFTSGPGFLHQGGNTATDPKITQRRVASQGKTLTKVQISNVIRTLLKGAKNLPKINIVSSLQEAFPDTPTDVPALFDPNSNQVFVEEGRHTLVEQISKDLYHEVTAH